MKKRIPVAVTSNYVLTTFYLNDVRYFHMEHRYITAHLNNGQKIRFYDTLENLECMYAPFGFVRIHRARIVNLSYIHRFSYETVTLTDGTQLEAGRSFSPAAKRTWKRYLENGCELCSEDMKKAD